jgi:hypothetical protein
LLSSCITDNTAFSLYGVKGKIEKKISAIELTVQKMQVKEPISSLTQEDERKY